MSGEKTIDHKFGGGWTELKLRAISDYLRFYTLALSRKPTPESPFETWYVDAFAGTGERTITQQSGGLLEGFPLKLDSIRLAGSAKRALAVDPPFKHYVFIEKDRRRFEALCGLRNQYPDFDIRCLPGDANVEPQKLFGGEPWTGARARLQRAVVFLDPYGMAVRWKTLQMLANTKRVDVWYLFPLHAVLRQLAHNHGAIDATKRAALNEVFGTEKWEDQFYRFRDDVPSLFGGMVTPTPSRNADPAQVEEFAIQCLRKLFPYVSAPIPILTRRQLQQFSLFCASANPSSIAIDLIKKGVAAQLKKYGRKGGSIIRRQT